MRFLRFLDDLFNLFRVALQPSANSSFAALLECPWAKALSGPLEHFDAIPLTSNHQLQQRTKSFEAQKGDWDRRQHDVFFRLPNNTCRCANSGSVFEDKNWTYTIETFSFSMSANVHYEYRTSNWNSATWYLRRTVKALSFPRRGHFVLRWRAMRGQLTSKCPQQVEFAQNWNLQNSCTPWRTAILSTNQKLQETTLNDHKQPRNTYHTRHFFLSDSV